MVASGGQKEALVRSCQGLEGLFVVPYYAIARVGRAGGGSRPAPSGLERLKSQHNVSLPGGSKEYAPD
jgi:hypothetical protein